MSRSTILEKQLLSPYQQRLETVEGRSLYFSQPILGVFSDSFPSETSDRYIDTANPTIIKTVGGEDEEFRDGAVAEILGTNQQVIRVGEELKFRSFSRDVLTSDRIYYIEKSGSDENDGKTTATAFASLIKALAVIKFELDLNGYKVTLQYGAGEFIESLNNIFVADDYITGGSLIIRGKANTILRPNTDISSHQIFNLNNVNGVSIQFETITFGGSVKLQGCEDISFLNCTYDPSDGVGFLFLDCYNCRDIVVYNLLIIPVPIGTNNPFALIRALDGSFIKLTGRFEIRNIQGSRIAFGAQTLTATRASFVDARVTWVGTAGGKRFSITENSHIETGTNDLELIPGSRPGQILTNSSYDRIEFVDSQYTNAAEAIAAIESRDLIYQSSQLPYSNGSTIVLAHDWLNFDPTLNWYQVQTWAVCTVASDDWAVGDRLLLNGLITTLIDETNISLRIPQLGISPATGNILNSNNWEIYIKASARIG